MKWMIASDIHGSEYYCNELLEAYHREKADRLLLLGDILYHGPRNDLPREYQPKRVIERLNEYKQDTICVRGNCDAGRYNECGKEGKDIYGIEEKARKHMRTI